MGISYELGCTECEKGGLSNLPQIFVRHAFFFFNKMDNKSSMRGDSNKINRF